MAPLLGGISAGDASELSIRAAFPQLVAMEREHGSLVRGMRAAARARARGEAAGGGRPRRRARFISLAGGVGELVDALVERLRADGVDAARRASGSRRSMRGARRVDAWSVEDGERVEADAVRDRGPSADRGVAARAARRRRSRRISASIACGSTTTVFLGYRRADVAHPLDGVGFVVPRAMRRPHPGGDVGVEQVGRAARPKGTCWCGRSSGGAWGEGVSSKETTRSCRSRAASSGPLMGLDAEPVLARVFRFDRAAPQMRVGHLALIARVRRASGAARREVQVAGGGTTASAFRTASARGRTRSRAILA